MSWELYENDPEHGAAEKHMDKVLMRWEHVGAYDSEPIGVVRWRVRKHFGCNGGWF